jgi:O-antigen/teichoic acid export membrane protein
MVEEPAMSTTDPVPTVSVPGRGRIGRNAIWNLVGLGLPLLFALVAIPVLLSALGTARFGVLSLAWVIIGYFGLFDLGLGRAITQRVARVIGTPADEQTPDAVWTYVWSMAILGALGGLALAGFSGPLVNDVLKIPAGLQAESSDGFLLLGLAVPFVVSTTGLRGVLEAHQRFAMVAIARVALGIVSILGPLLVIPFTHSLAAIVAVLVVGRVVAWVAHVMLCGWVDPRLGRPRPFRFSALKPMLGFAGWMTVSNVFAPLLAYLDRFLIAAVISASAVAYYATPYDIVTKLSIFPLALSGVLFPAFASLMTHRPHEVEGLHRRGLATTMLLLGPLIAVIVVFGHGGLEAWLGGSFADRSTTVLQWLAVGVFANAAAQIPFTLIQGVGRPDITAKLQLAELPFYLVLLWVMVKGDGIVGAALAWAIRVTIDAVLLLALAQPAIGTTMKRSLGLIGALLAGTAVLAAGMIVPDAAWEQGAAVTGYVLVTVILAHRLGFHLRWRQRRLVRAAATWLR